MIKKFKNHNKCGINACVKTIYSLGFKKNYFEKSEKLMLPSGDTSMTGTLLPIASIEAEIQSFENFIREFNFAGLRARKHGERSVADDASIQDFLSYFSSHFFQNPDDALRSYFRSLTRAPKIHADLIIRLATALLAFRESIENTDRVFFAEKENNEAVGNFMAELKPNSTWVMRFQFTIEMPLTELAIDTGDCHYIRSIKNLQNLCEDVAEWASKNCSDEVFEQFKVLASIGLLDELARNKPGEASRGIKRKKPRELFSAFFPFPPAKPDLDSDESSRPPLKKRRTFNYSLS